jgi:hypothetical protein
LLLVSAAIVSAAIVVAATPGRSEAATGTVVVRGSVTCPAGQRFAGARVVTSTGGGGGAHSEVYPHTGGQMAKVSRTLEGVRLPSTVSLTVGCGIERGRWRHVISGLGKVRTGGSGTVFINVACNTDHCLTAPRGPAGPAGGAANPMSDSTQCTNRAAAFWRAMTGSFPSWGGDAGWWDDNSVGWAKRGWAEPDSLMVWQPGPTSSTSGHVGYVADTRVAAGTIEVKIYDRNWGSADRHGAWIPIPPDAEFIRVPPRFTPDTL